MSSPYRVEVDVGVYSLASQDGDPASYGLADPLTLSYSVPQTDLAPIVQRDPDEATVNVIAPDPWTYTFTLGDQVRVAVYSDHAATVCTHSFFGRIAQLTAQPHKLGILYTLQCVDYLADLAELKAGRADYPLEDALTRVNRMLDENSIGPVVVEGSAWVAPTVRARLANEGAVSLAEEIESTINAWTTSQVNDETGNPAFNVVSCRYELAPNIVNPGGVVGQGTLDGDSPFKLTPIYRPQGYAPPARLATVPDYHLTVDPADTSPSTGSLILDAGDVEFAPSYVQSKGNAINAVVILDGLGNYNQADWQNWGKYVPVKKGAALEATLTTRQNIITVAPEVYRGSIPADPGASWVVGTITWLASRTQPAAWQGPGLRRVCTIARVDAVNPSSHVPTGKAWIVGVTSALGVTVQGGEVTLGITLAPMNWTALGPGWVPHQARFDSPLLAGVTWAQLHATDTWIDYLLLYVP